MRGANFGRDLDVAKCKISRLHGHSHRRVAGGIAADAEDVASDLARVFILRDVETCVRAVHIQTPSQGHIKLQVIPRLLRFKTCHRSRWQDENELSSGRQRLRA